MLFIYFYKTMGTFTAIPTMEKPMCYLYYLEAIICYVFFKLVYILLLYTHSFRMSITISYYMSFRNCYQGTPGIWYFETKCADLYFWVLPQSYLVQIQ